MSMWKHVFSILITYTSVVFLSSLACFIILLTRLDITAPQHSIPLQPTKPESNPHLQATDSYPITIVTAYFHLPRSKHSFEDYSQWINHWYGQVQAPIVIYTDCKHQFLEHSYRNDSSKYPTVYVEMALSETFMHQKYSATYKQHHRSDPERAYHSPELYTIWNSKAWFLFHTSNVLNPFNSQYFVWSDIGAFRDPVQSQKIFGNPQWPDINRVEKTFKHCPECVALGMVNPFNKDQCTVFQDHIQGTFIMGTKLSLKWWFHTFMKMHDRFIENSIFVGKDQTMMNTLVLQKQNQKKILLLNATNGACGGQWFYYTVYFSGSNEISEQQNKCLKIMGTIQSSEELIPAELSLTNDKFFDAFKSCVPVRVN